jgi:hypothetical protein
VNGIQSIALLIVRETVKLRELKVKKKTGHCTSSFPKIFDLYLAHGETWTIEPMNNHK